MLNILLADDNAVLRDGISKLLEFEIDLKVVGAAASTKEAIDFILQNDVHLVITDINMPVTDGYELIRELLYVKPELKIIVFSMMGTKYHVTKAFETGALGYLLKDTNADELLFAFRHVSQGKRYICSEMSLDIFEKCKAAESL